MSHGQVVDATRGRILAGDSERSPSGFSIDSRTLERGDLFFAIRGPRRDGHEFVRAALAAGAAGAVVASDRADLAEGAPEGAAVIAVEDTTRALQDLAASVRRRAAWTVAAITGSVGKTTTKDLTRLLLAGSRRVHASAGNLNNHYGLPLALLRAPEETEVLVLEMGISTPGEMDRLIEIAEPDLGLVTLISRAHVGNFESFRDLAEEKMKLPRHAKRALLNADDPEQRSRRAALERPIEFGSSATGQGAVRLLAIDGRGLEGSDLRLEHAGHVLELTCPLPGAHQARNLLAASALALALDVEPDVLAQRAERAEPAPHRGQLLRVGGVTIVDDCYNANPPAMVAALELLESSPVSARGRRIFVAGDMLDLGGTARDEHRRLGELVSRRPVDLFLGVGEEAATAVEVARGARRAAEHVKDAEAAGRWLVETVREGDLVLVKGSRGVGLERAIEILVERRNRR